MTTKTKITFIGAGNMASSIIAGLTEAKAAVDVTVSDPNENQLAVMSTQFPHCTTTMDNHQAVRSADVVVLAVKPQMMQGVCEALQETIQQTTPMIISVAAGVSESSLNQWLGGGGLPIVRCMPNTPSLVQAGMSGLFANSNVSDEQKTLAESMLHAVGLVLWFDDEDMLHAVTAVSGSGPAYFFLVMEAMQASAESLGLTPEQASVLVQQTAFGAAKLAMSSDDSSAVLRQKVTSKGGTTEAAINQLQSSGLEGIFDNALKAAVNRSIVLSGGTPATDPS